MIMPTILEGQLVAGSARFGVVAGRFNSFITQALLDGAVDTLKRHGVADENIRIVWCPGSFEIPLVAQKMAKSGDYDAIVCLGAVIRGSTTHYDLVSNEVAKGVGQVALQTGLPVIFGVITVDSIEQAIERAGTKAGNKGSDAAMAAIEMVNLLDRL